MPELTVHSVWICASNVHWTYVVPSASGTGKYTVTYGPVTKGQYLYHYTCSCPDFLWKYEPSKGQHVCKHIKSVTTFRCGWMGEPGGESAHQLPDGSRVCPKCGGPLVSIQVAT
jgi:hypothetical protein